MLSCLRRYCISCRGCYDIVRGQTKLLQMSVPPERLLELIHVHIINLGMLESQVSQRFALGSDPL